MKKMLTCKEFNEVNTKMARISSMGLMIAEWNNLCDKADKEQQEGGMYYTAIRMGFVTAVIYGNTEFFKIYENEIMSQKKIEIDQ